MTRALRSRIARESRPRHLHARLQSGLFAYCWLALVVACGLLAPTGARAGDPFADFRIPSHRWSSGAAELRFESDGTSSSIGVQRHRDRLWNSLDYARLSEGWDSDALRVTGEVQLEGILMGRSYWSDLAPSPTWTGSTASVGQTTAEVAAFATGVRVYPWSAPVGLDFSASGIGLFSQGWGRQDLTETQLVIIPNPTSRQRTTTDSHQSVQMAQVAAAAGLGRVRDATVVMDVHVLEQRLLAAGAITGPLDTATRERLAALLTVAPEYAEVHTRPDRYVWKDVERILREGGALSERGLDPYALLRAREPYQYATLREVGWFVGPVLSAVSMENRTTTSLDYTYRTYVADTLYGVSHASAHTELRTGDDSAWLGGEAEVHRPLGWAWQFDGSARAQAPIRPGESGFDLTLSARAVWLIADRWQASGQIQQERQYFSPRGADGRNETDEWAVGYSAALGYFLEDRTELTLSLGESQTGNAFGGYTRDGRATLGVTYRFLGRMEAPGLIEPVVSMR